MPDIHSYDGIELTSQEAHRLHRWTDEGYAYWNWTLLSHHEFNPVEYARNHGDDGRTERTIVNGLVAKGLITPTETKGVYRFTKQGLRWIFRWRQLERNYPLPWQMQEAEANG